MAFVYVLKSSKDNKLYVGSTRQNIKERINRHNNGQVQSTKYRRPLSLLYSEHFDDYSHARKKELYLKSGSGREHLNRILVRWAGTQVAKGGRL
ncbi:MAG: GIY-YIG nuclease family protein [Candidatus Omnitrophica bacterium]|nr:GIY-YIG nuclease family protein [Candidatus Omnitrophota bacterium]MDD5592614.1 GIY-YIG nuclease family protein [Candidatus Omnitrophota bacterium]